jgi:hypothetical protein
MVRFLSVWGPARLKSPAVASIAGRRQEAVGHPARLFVLLTVLAVVATDNELGQRASWVRRGCWPAPNRRARNGEAGLRSNRSALCCEDEQGLHDATA